jgi:small subunit ribosomal protein S3
VRAASPCIPCADIDYGFAEAKTTYGIIGVKVLIFKGEVLKQEQK